MGARVLVAYATQYGSTQEVAEAVAATLRELGIPVVVGCSNATMLLHTGDWVRVNGGQGTVEVLKEQEQIVMRVSDQG